jgi:hypothetical protein
MRVYGGKVTLRDDLQPVLNGPAEGTLVEDGVLKGTETLTVNATDSGSGIYRVRLLLGDEAKISKAIDTNSGRCVDANPANDDVYEFIHGQPCKLSAGGTFGFDTTTLPEGSANLKVQVEDAGGTAATVINRTVTVDNIDPPSNTTAPAISGRLEETHRLTADPGAWDDHGAAGDPTISYQWQRCDRLGANCVDIAGATEINYDLTHDEVGRTVRVIELAENSEGEVSAASSVSQIVTREDGTLPDDRDGLDNDGDGQVDEAGERGPSPVTDPPLTTTPTIEASGNSAVRTPINGQGASRQARLSVAFADSQSRKLTSKYGKSRTVVGRLTDEHGRPITGAVVEVSSIAAMRGAGEVAGKALTTAADGSFRYVASGKSASRTLRFVYRYENPGSIVAEDSLQLAVKAAVKLSVKITGARVTYSGRVLSGPIPKSGKLVVIQGRVRGSSWQTFATRTAKGKGAFKGAYRLKVRSRGTRLQFRARVLTEAGYPYASVNGRTITRKVR